MTFASNLTRIMVATDFSETAHRALERVSLLPINSNAIIKIVHVGATPADLARLTEQAAFLKNSLAGHNSVTIETEMLQGPIAQSIVEAANSLKAELIVMGKSQVTTGRLGSTSAKVSHESPIATLLVSSRPEGSYQRPLCAVSDDPTFEMERSLAQILDRKTVPLAVIHAWQMPYQGRLEMTGESPILLEQDRANMRVSAHNHLESQMTHLKRVFSHAVFHLREGESSAVITSEAKAINADLLILMPHVRPFWFRTLLGGTTDWVLNHVDCDILLVKYVN